MRRVSEVQRQYRLSEVIHLISGGTPRTSCPDYWGGEIPWITAADLSREKRFIESTKRSITEQGLKHSSTNMLQKGDCIIAARGTIGVVNQLQSPMAFNQTCYGIRANPDILDSGYMYYLLRNCTSQFDNIAHGGVFQTITRSMFDEINVMIPTPEKQQKDSICLSRMDIAIEINNQLICSKIAMRRYFINMLLSGFVRFSAFGTPVSKLGEVPNGWTIKKIRNVCRLEYGEAWGRVKSSDGIPVYGTGGLMGHSKRALSDGPAIIIGRKGTIDKPFYVNHPFWCVDTTFYAQAISDDDLEFLAYKLSILDWKRYNEASGLPSLNRNTLLSITLSMPPIQEQRAISRFLKIMDSELDLLVKKRKMLAEMKKGMLSKLFTSIGSGGYDG